jgi:predicted dehydrogenase
MTGNGSQTVRVAMVGAGAIAQLAHLPSVAKMRGVDLVAVCDNDAAKARALAGRFGAANVFTDIEEVLELDELDALIIATPNHAHEPHVLSALARKKHVLCERPLALSARGVERILAASERHDRVVHVANNLRFRSDVQALAGFLQGGELGKPVGVRAGSYRLKAASPGWRASRPEAGGGAFMELGVPMLDLAFWLLDSPTPERVSAHMTRARGAKAVEDAMLVHVECEGGLSFSLDVTWSYVGEEERWWFEVLAGRGSARLAPLRVVKELNGRAVDVSPSGAAARESAFLQSYRAELAHFIAVVRGESEYEPPADQVPLHRVLEAIYKAADEGKEIRL